MRVKHRFHWSFCWFGTGHGYNRTMVQRPLNAPLPTRAAHRVADSAGETPPPEIQALQSLGQEKSPSAQVGCNPPAIKQKKNMQPSTTADCGPYVGSLQQKRFHFLC
jgi:hypothetical protein